MRRAIGVLAIGAIIVVALASVGYAAVPEKVLDKPGLNEDSPAASPDYFAWVQNVRSNRHRYNTYVRPSGGGDRVRVNPKGTNSYNVGIDGSLIVYQSRALHDDDNLEFYDAATQARPAMSDGVNTPGWESRPTLSGDWLLFTRTNVNLVNFEDSWTKVILFNLVTEERRVLRSAWNRRAYLVSDQVNGDWATFEWCRFSLNPFQYWNCNVFRYRISIDKLVKIANPGVQQYAGGISEDGTIYMVRAGGRNVWHCGKNMRIVRYPVGGPDVVIARLKQDALTTFVADEVDGSTTLYSQKQRCTSRNDGIYRISAADTAT
jgi:hypothetical protein